MNHLNYLRFQGARRDALRRLQKTLFGSAAPEVECRGSSNVEPITARRNIQPCIQLLHCSPRGLRRPSDTHRSLASNTETTFIQHGQFPRHFTYGACGRRAVSFSPSLSTLNSSPRSNDDQVQEAERTALDFSLLSSLISTDQGPGNALSLWYVLTTAALLAFHQASAVGDLWKYISVLRDLDPSQEATVARRIREACLKSSVLVGFPRVSL
jgi:hypothetical protein